MKTILGNITDEAYCKALRKTNTVTIDYGASADRAVLQMVIVEK